MVASWSPEAILRRCDSVRAESPTPNPSDAVTLHHTCRSRPARVVQRDGQRKRAPPASAVAISPAHVLGAHVRRHFPHRFDGRGCRLGACALRLRAFLGVGHRASSAPLVSGDGHRKRGRLPRTPFPVSARGPEADESLRTPTLPSHAEGVWRMASRLSGAAKRGGSFRIRPVSVPVSNGRYGRAIPPRHLVVSTRLRSLRRAVRPCRPRPRTTSSRSRCRPRSPVW